MFNYLQNVQMSELTRKIVENNNEIDQLRTEHNELLMASRKNVYFQDERKNEEKCKCASSELFGHIKKEFAADQRREKLILLMEQIEATRLRD